MTIGFVVPGCPLAPLRPDRKRHSLWELSAGQKTGQKAAQPVAKPDRKRHSLWQNRTESDIACGARFLNYA
jgi:hypothetical protein